MTDCIFCKIVSRGHDTVTLYDDGNVVAFRDANPKAPVHVLVVPKAHIEQVHEVWTADGVSPVGVMISVFKAIRMCVVTEGLDKTGYRVVTNNGVDGRQTVKHLHFHVLGGHLLGENIH